mgnify:CR=1 FL=1
MEKEALFSAASTQEKIGFAGMLRLNNAAAAHLALFRFGAFKMIRLLCERLFVLRAI